MAECLWCQQQTNWFCLSDRRARCPKLAAFAAAAAASLLNSLKVVCVLLQAELSTGFSSFLTKQKNKNNKAVQRCFISQVRMAIRVLMFQDCKLDLAGRPSWPHLSANLLDGQISVAGPSGRPDNVCSAPPPIWLGLTRRWASSLGSRRGTDKTFRLARARPTRPIGAFGDSEVSLRTVEI